MATMHLMFALMLLCQLACACGAPSTPESSPGGTEPGGGAHGGKAASQVAAGPRDPPGGVSVSVPHVGAATPPVTMPALAMGAQSRRTPEPSGMGMADGGAGPQTRAAPDSGMGEPPPDDSLSAPPFVLGADISSVHEQEYTFIDTDGRTKSIFELLQHHGFNYARVKTFVAPFAPHGYASMAGGCVGFSEAFSDRDHVIAFGRKIKAAGMGFLLDFHYSDVWADPGKQHIPAAWRGLASIDELAARMKAYTRDVLSAAVAAGARPDIVQIGNEITPGLLMHVPGPNTDCWGNQPEEAPIGGSVSNWDHLATLLRAGIEAVQEIDASIEVMLHIENTDDLEGVQRWVDSALRHGVDFDVLGLSCYTAFQGSPSTWEATFQALAATYPELKFAVAEYNPERTRANLIVRDLPDGRGLGTFLWEPTRSGEWGQALFTPQGSTLLARPSDFAEFDRLAVQLGLR